MHLSAFSGSGADLDPLAETLLQMNVKVHTLSRYYLGAQRRSGFILGYGAVDHAEIRHGLKQLRRVLTP
jgi:GntR family transcriptional regulator/MocR family aminotransferase